MKAPVGALLVLSAFLAPAALPISAADFPGEFAPLKFLLGKWEADAPGSGNCEFAPEAQGKLLVRRNHAEVPAANGRPAGVHDDLMVIYREGAKTRADYYDSEGHVIRYAVETSEGQVVFLSDPAAAAPRYRLTYQLQKDGNVAGKFELSPPGATEAFRPYLTWVMHHGSAKQ